jgi:CheY-like chemotaxis protein
MFNIMTLQCILENGFNVSSDKALNGKEAVESVINRINKDPCLCPRNGSGYKLIFMDCNMPVMDGFQATAEIRKLQSKCPIYIVALTAYSTESFKEKAFQCGVDAFLTKPISEDKVGELIK